MENQSFLKVMLNVLRREGETALAFGREVQALSDADKAWYAAALRDAGYPCNDPQQRAAAA